MLKNTYLLKLSIYSRVSYNCKPPYGGYGCERVKGKVKRVEKSFTFCKMISCIIVQQTKGSPKNVTHCENILNIFVKSYQSKMYRETDTKQFENCHFQ